MGSPAMSAAAPAAGPGSSTPPDRRFRFAVTASTASDAAAWRELATRTEDQGYDALYMSDHANPQLAPVPALVAAATATSMLRVGTLVLANDLRNPVITAKEIATLDLLSEGRCDWGMGTGWLPTDYEATGMPADAAAIKVDRLAESIAVMKALLAGETVDHDGAHYRIHGAKGSPESRQEPHPPLLVGAGQPRMLALAGREADIVSIAPAPRSRQFGPYPPQMGVEESMDDQVDRLVRSAGDRATSPERSVNLSPAQVADNASAAAAKVAQRVGLTPEQALVSPHLAVGPVSAICESLQARRQRWGISHLVVPARAATQFAPVVARLAGT